jgi:hypothetical protein
LVDKKNKLAWPTVNISSGNLNSFQESENSRCWQVI